MIQRTPRLTRTDTLCPYTTRFRSKPAQGGTAVGTGLNAPAGFDVAIAEELSKSTGIAFEPASNKFEALASNDGLVFFSGALNTLGVARTKIANEIRLLGSRWEERRVGKECGSTCRSWWSSYY